MHHHTENFKKKITGNKSNGNKTLELKILKLRAPVRKTSLKGYIPLIIFFPIFWTWIFANLLICRPKLILACDLDTVIPCYIYKKIFHRKLAFYIFDRYALTYIPQKFKTLFDLIHGVEEFFSKESDVLITVGESVLKTFKKKPMNCSIIANYPPDSNKCTRQTRKQDKVFTIVYGGHIMSGRGLENIACAIKDLANVALYMYGLLIDENLLTKLVSIPNIVYKGYMIDTDDYYKSIMSADAMIAVYSLDNPSNSITMHNKTYEAMMCGYPIITNLSAELVKEVGFGLTVDYHDINAIRAAIVRLRDDPVLCRTMGDNGRKAFLEKYNWKITEKELFKVCDKLLGRNNPIMST